jgi:hypothetical protein
MLAADNAESTQAIAPSLPQGAHDAVSIRSSSFSAASPASPPPPLSSPGSDIIGKNRHLSARFTFASFTITSSTPRQLSPCCTHEHPSASCSTFHSLPVGPKQAKFLTRQDLRLPNRRPIALPLQNYALHASKAAEDEPVFTITSVFHSTTAAFPPNPFFPQSLEGLRAQLEELTYKQKRLERNIHTMQLQRTARLQSQQPAPLQRAVETQESSSTGSAPPQTAVGLVKSGGTRSNAAGQRLKAADDEKSKAPRFLNLENVSE